MLKTMVVSLCQKCLLSKLSSCFPIVSSNANCNEDRLTRRGAGIHLKNLQPAHFVSYYYLIPQLASLASIAGAYLPASLHALNHR